MGGIIDINKLENPMKLDDFTFPSGINIEQYNLVIWKRSSTTGYRLVFIDKTDYIRLQFNSDYSIRSIGFYKSSGSPKPNSSYYDTGTDDKIFKYSGSSGSFGINSTGYFVYSDALIYGLMYDTGETVLLYDPSVPAAPDIDIDISVNDNIVNVEFSLIDNDKYVYQYAFGQHDNWTNIYLTEDNTFQFPVSESGIVYVRVLDKKNNDVVNSYNFTVIIKEKLEPTLTNYVKSLKRDKYLLIDFLLQKGIDASANETFTSLIKKIRDFL